MARAGIIRIDVSAAISEELLTALRDDFHWQGYRLHFFADDYGLDNPYPTSQGGANVPGFNALSTGRAQLATLSFTSTFGPTAVNELHLGYMRTANHVGQPAGGVGPALVSQGFVDPSGNPGIVALDPRIEGVENIAFNVLNHAQFFGAASVDGNISSASFGQIVGAQAPREIQVAARFRF